MKGSSAAEPSSTLSGTGNDSPIGLSRTIRENTLRCWAWLAAIRANAPRVPASCSDPRTAEVDAQERRLELDAELRRAAPRRERLGREGEVEVAGLTRRLAGVGQDLGGAV